MPRDSRLPRILGRNKKVRKRERTDFFQKIRLITTGLLTDYSSFRHFIRYENRRHVRHAVAVHDNNLARPVASLDFPGLARDRS